MSLSLLIILIFLVLLIPTILLPLNKLKTYILSFTPGFIICFFLFFLFLNFPDIEYSLGNSVYHIFSFILNSYKELNIIERAHYSAYLFLIIMYFVCYLITYILIKLVYIGKNPSIHKATNILVKISLSSIFIIYTSFFTTIILIEIRGIIPLQDGFLKPIFSSIYSIEA